MQCGLYSIIHGALNLVWVSRIKILTESKWVFQIVTVIFYIAHPKLILLYSGLMAFYLLDIYLNSQGVLFMH